MPESLDDQLQVRQIQILADGACDDMALAFFEIARGESLSKEWFDRQLRKVNGVIRAMDELVRKNQGQFLVCGEFSVADIAVGAILGMMDLVETDYNLVLWENEYPELNNYLDKLECRESLSRGHVGAMFWTKK
jgi:glutathione S-transferase